MATTTVNDILASTGTNNVLDVDIGSIAAGTNNIGDVDVLSLPPIPAGTNNIGGITGTGVMVAASINNRAGVGADVLLAVPAQAGLRLVGFSCRESAATAAAATFRILHGDLATSPEIVPVELKADESRADWFGDSGISCPNGITIDWIAGTVDINLFFKVVA